MVHDLFGMMEDRKLDNPATLLLTYGSTTSSPSSTPSFSLPNSSTSSEPQQNIRCPRCDSSNTKFCYYNNYNLTQPRHFCKTCRRYWTKGGALRNVPIGGGCRKVKPCRSAAAKPKPATPILSNFDHELQSPAAALWNSPYSSQLLDLIRSSQFQNPNPNLTRIKEDSSIFSQHLAAEPAGAMYDQGLGLDSLGQLSITPYNSLWRNGGNHYTYHQQQAPQQHNMFMGEMQSPSGIQELLQRLKTSSSYNYGSLSSSVNTSTATSSTTSSILEPLPLSGGDVGYWNPNPAPLSWADLQADLQTTNGGFP